MNPNTAKFDVDDGKEDQSNGADMLKTTPQLARLSEYLYNEVTVTITFPAK
jgi:hypothetical protein